MLQRRAATLLLLLYVASTGRAARDSPVLKQLKSTVQSLKDQVSDMTALVSGMTAQNINITEQYTNMTAQYTNMAAQYTNITAQNINITAQYTDMAAQYTNITAQNINITAQYTNMTAMYTNMLAQNINITAQYTNMTAQYTNMAAQYTNITAQMEWFNEQPGFKQWVENNTFNEDQSKILLSAITENLTSQDTRIQEPSEVHDTREWVTVVVGGYTNISHNTVAAQVLGGNSSRALANYPQRVSWNRMVVIGSKIHSCGGYSNARDTAECFMMDMKDNNKTWQKSRSLMRRTSEHHLSVANGDIMAIYEDGAISINATIYEGFDVGSTDRESCLASNSTHSFFFHGGIVHMNVNASDPANWENITAIDISGRGVGCLLFDAVLYITRGDKLFMISTDNFIVVQGASPNTPRRDHGMGIIDGRVAVVGGSKVNAYSELDSIETYNRLTDKWQTLAWKLLMPNGGFGIVSLQL